MSDLVGVVLEPSGSRLFEASMEDMTVSTLDHSRTDGQVQFEGVRVIQRIGAVAQVSVAVAHWGLLGGGPVRFKMR